MNKVFSFVNVNRLERPFEKRSRSGVRRIKCLRIAVKQELDGIPCALIAILSEEKVIVVWHQGIYDYRDGESLGHLHQFCRQEEKVLFRTKYVLPITPTIVDMVVFSLRKDRLSSCHSPPITVRLKVRLTLKVSRTVLIYFPFHSGFLFSTNAFIPSFWSSLAKSM